MQKFAKLGFAAWCLWLVVDLVVTVAHLPGRDATIFVWVASVGGLSMIAGGCVLTWVLMKHPRRGLSMVLAILVALLLWKFYVGEIVFAMHPQLGGYTFSQSVSVWWSHHTSSIARFMLWFPPMVLLAASLVFYPVYCGMHDHAN